MAEDQNDSIDDMTARVSSWKLSWGVCKKMRLQADSQELDLTPGMRPRLRPPFAHIWNSVLAGQDLNAQRKLQEPMLAALQTLPLVYK
jgi:hypothetical protein